MSKKSQMILQDLPRIRNVADGLRETILANLIMLEEVNAPTFYEQDRASLAVERLAEYGLENCSVDEKMNGFGILPGKDGKRNILLVSNSDSLVGKKQVSTVEIQMGNVFGPFVGDNSPALASIVSIPLLLEKLGLELKSNLILMAASRSLGRANLEGLKFFLNETTIPIHFGLFIESVALGRLNHTCLGIMRGDIICSLPKNYNWARFGSMGSIIPMNDVISQISNIPLPNRPLTRIIMGSIHGGVSYQSIARNTTLSFEVRSGICGGTYPDRATDSGY